MSRNDKGMFKVNLDKAPSGRIHWALHYSGGEYAASGNERTLRLARYAVRLAKSRLLKR